jgi:adenylate kinase
MRIVLLGAPGAGKGTVSKLITAKNGAVQISTGDMLRKEMKDGSALGRKAEDYIKRGDLVPDGVILDMMKERLQQPDCKTGFILDGFPRTIPQAEALTALFEALEIELDGAVDIDVPRDVLMGRLTSRRTCSNGACQAIYNVISNPTKDGIHCDKCGSPVVQREDETEEAISHRLATYDEKTLPLIEFYSAQKLLIKINGNQNPEKVFDELMRSLKK